MARRLCIAALTLTAVLTGAAALAQGKLSGRAPWWRNTKIQHELVLSDRQVLLLEQIFQQQLTARIALQRDLERLELAVQQALDRGEPDDAVAMHAIERVEQVRMQQNIRRALMLLAMSKVLMPEQREKLPTLVDSPPLTLTR
jgi:Spy/CpxP family protein refolding chaperone